MSETIENKISKARAEAATLAPTQLMFIEDRAARQSIQNLSLGTYNVLNSLIDVVEALANKPIPREEIKDLLSEAVDERDKGRFVAVAVSLLYDNPIRCREALRERLTDDEIDALNLDFLTNSAAQAA